MRARILSPRDWNLSLSVAPPVACALMRLGYAAIRRRDIGREHPEACWARGERVIVTFWHGRLLMMPFAYRSQSAAILISQHRDGEYIARIAGRLGFSVVRGSATRGGARAFRRLVQVLRSESNVAITPDGPKGPRRRVKSGVVELSRLSGMAILPVSFGAWPRTLLNSWDEFLVPHPFARGVYAWGEPIYVPSEITDPEHERFQGLVAERLDALTAQADWLARGG